MAVLRVIFLGCALSIGGAAAGNASSHGWWGAVAAGPGPQAWGSAWNRRSPGFATREARRRCRGRCTVVKAFRGKCGAIATARGRFLGQQRWVWGYGTSPRGRQRAIRKALWNCQQRRARYMGNCNIRAWACTRRRRVRVPVGPTGQVCRWRRSFKHAGQGCFCRVGPRIGGHWRETRNTGACSRTGR